MKRISLFFIVLALFLGCSKHNKIVQPIKIEKNVQIATLTTQKQQWSAILEVIKDNTLTAYQYDSEAINSGRVQSISDNDHWNYASYFEIQELKKQIEAGINENFKVKVDCDDSMIHLYIALLKKGYPADQLSWNYYLIPPSLMTGVIQSLGGHAVLIAEVEGKVPYSLEDIDNPREVFVIEEELGYYNVGFLTMENDIRTPWSYTDNGGYTALSQNEISLDVAKATYHYKNRTNWTHAIFRRNR